METQQPIGAQVELDVRPVATHLGAEIRGLDLAGPLTDGTAAALRAALLAHKVLFFHDQRLDHAGQVALGRGFGELASRPGDQGRDPAEDPYPEVRTFSPRIERARLGRDVEAHLRRRWRTPLSGWHIDMSHTVNPPTLSILRAERVPAAGGDTQWTSLVAAYEGLAAPLREWLCGLRAEHSFFAGYAMIPTDPVDREVLHDVGADPLVAVHPVVRVHPETGQLALFVNPSRTARIIGVSPPESRAVLDLLFEQMTRAEYTVRFRWAPGSVAIWDNRSTAHVAPPDLDDLDVDRVVHRVTVLGDRPIGPDGFRSEAVLGRPFGASA